MSDQPPYQPGPPPQPGQHPPQQPGYPGPPPGGYGYGQPYGYAPAPPPSSTTWAVVAHIGPLVGGFLVPLLVYLLVSDDPFTRRHAAEALNVQLAALLASVLGVIAMVVPVLFVAASSSGSGSGTVPVLWILWMILLGVALVGLSIYLVVTAIIGMIRAGRHEEYRYPLTIRFVKP